MYKTSMPKIEKPADLTERESRIFDLILNSKTGALRASAPTLEKMTEYPDPEGIIFKSFYDYPTDDGKLKGEAYYVWRMVAFFVSPMPAHHCMPCTVDFYLGGKNYDERRARTKQLDSLVDKITNMVPKTQWYGVARWARALS